VIRLTDVRPDRSFAASATISALASFMQADTGASARKMTSLSTDASQAQRFISLPMTGRRKMAKATSEQPK